MFRFFFCFVRLFIYLFVGLIRNFFNYIFAGDNFSGCSSFSARLSLQPKLSRASLISDEPPTEYRRKSAGSPNATVYNSAGFGSVSNNTEPYIYAFDECERHPDGTVVLR